MTLRNKQPDKISYTPGWGYLFYYLDGRDMIELTIGAKYTVIYPPSIHNTKWRSVCMRVVHFSSKEKPITQAIETRLLAHDEISYFQSLLAEYAY